MVQESVVRGIALLVMVTAAASLAMQLPVLMYLLAADFLLRAAGKTAWSPLAGFTRHVLVRVLPFTKRMIYAPPKRFAAGIGAGMSAAAAVSASLGVVQGMYVLTGILILFSFLEAAFRFCAGCAVYSALQRLLRR